jgi:hypothetical protein
MIRGSGGDEPSEDIMHKGKRTKSPDLKVSRLKSDTWQVAPVSHRARDWLAKHVPEEALAAERLETDVHAINRLAASARGDGLVIEFNGPLDTIHL